MAIKLAVVTAIDATMAGLILPQLKAAQEAGFEVHGVCSEGPRFDMFGKKGIKMKAVRIKRRISPFSDLSALWKMYRYFKKEKFDIVHTHTPKVSLLGQIAAKLAGVPIIVNTVHGFYFHENMKSVPRKFYIMMEKIAAKYSSMMLSQNPEDIETALQLGFCYKSRIKLLGNGVDLSVFDPTKFNHGFKKQKRSELGLPDEAVVIGIIGRLVREKGYLELFEAMRSVMAHNNKVWLLIVGAEEPEKDDRISSDSFEQYGIAERVIYLSRRKDVPEILSCCDIYTLPSWREGFPRSAIEAAAMGLPVVATNIRGCRQVVDDGVSGILVEFLSVKELEEALVKLVDNEKLRRSMGQRGYEKSRKYFDERKVCRIVIDTYKDLLKNCLQITI